LLRLYARSAIDAGRQPLLHIEDGEVTLPKAASSRNSDRSVSAPAAIDNFVKTMVALLEQHRPSRMAFFSRFASLPREVAGDPLLLGKIHLYYQSAMHATRAAVYYLPHLDSPALRKRKLQIFIDDDGLAGGDTHHYQLTRAFISIGAKCLLEDEKFGEPEELSRHLDAETAHFVRLAPKLYSRSLGPWCAIEVMSVDWMQSLADSISVHFPNFKHQPYFTECFIHEVEERHAAEALEVTQAVLRVRPELLRATLRDAKIIATALDGVWTHLDRIVLGAATVLGAGHRNEIECRRMEKQTSAKRSAEQPS
jgi:pyrroloquinoline quinone (PQQ) biosynthesis protein C